MKNTKMTDLREELKALPDPYWVGENPSFNDYNREIIEPGMIDVFPEGAIGIRVDDDFWAVAALPLSYIDTPLEDIVEALWPEHTMDATYNPDVGVYNVQKTK